METLPNPDRGHLCLDEDWRRLDPSLNILRLSNTSCLIIEPVIGTREPQVFKRVGYWVSSGSGSVTFGPSGGEEGLGGWEMRVVILI
jgi:hypothetical protein